MLPYLTANLWRRCPCTSYWSLFTINLKKGGAHGRLPEAALGPRLATISPFWVGHFPFLSVSFLSYKAAPSGTLSPTSRAVMRRNEKKRHGSILQNVKQGTNPSQVLFVRVAELGWPPVPSVTCCYTLDEGDSDCGCTRAANLQLLSAWYFSKHLIHSNSLKPTAILRDRFVISVS